MTTSILQIMHENLVNRSIEVCVVNATHNISKIHANHVYLTEPDIPNTYDKRNWSNVSTYNTTVKIIGVTGGYVQYEGNYLGLTVMLNGKEHEFDVEAQEDINIL